MPSRNRGKSKPKLRDLSRIPPTDEDRRAVREALRDIESPIATAILGASIVEYELETELRDRFRRSDDETWELLTSDIGPLGTFNQKIIAAYGFGIIDETVKDGMDTVRRIRNAFAHTKRLIDFDNELVVRELASVTLPTAKRSELYKELASVRAAKSGPRTAYAMLCLIMGLQLLNRRNKRFKDRSAARSARARLRQRREAFSDALHSTPPLGRIGLLGLLGGYPPVDPKNTIAGQGLLGDVDLESSDSDNEDKQ